MRCIFKPSSYKFTDNKQFKNLVNYQQRGQYRNLLNLKVGDKLRDFEVKQVKKFVDFDIQYVSLVCRKSGLKWHHFDCEEETNTFGFTIDCKSTPHLIILALQKIIQCGSKKYPIRDIFSQMRTRSLCPNNFTHCTEDNLFFGFQTSSFSDHKSLLDVTLSTVFHPLLRKQDFSDVIYRYRYDPLTNTISIDGELALQLDQMWYSSNRLSIHNSVQKGLFGREKLCKKQDLVNLTYPQLVRYYHQVIRIDNSTIFTHGDMYLPHLINEYEKQAQALGIFSRYIDNKNRSLSAEVQQQAKKNINKISEGEEFRQQTITFEQLDKASPMILSFKLNQISAEDSILLQVLSYLLFDMPKSIMMNWNTPQTPYPKLYGYQQTHFNLGITIKLKQTTDNPYNIKLINPTQEQYFEKQQQIVKTLTAIYKDKFPNYLIEQCLLHLEGQYYQSDGIKIITEGCLVGSSETKVSEVLNVKATISNILKRYRRQNLFENALKKYILENEQFVRIRGKHNSDLMDNSQFQEQYSLKKKWAQMPIQQKNQIKSYSPPSLLQNSRILPILDISQLETFEQKSPIITNISGIQVFHVHKCDGIKLSLKIDISDIDEDQIRLLPIICQTFPFMGYQGLKNQTYSEYINFYIKSISMKYESIKSPDGEGMKIFMFLQLQFSDRNSQFGFNLFSNLLHNHDDKNISIISSRIQKVASQTYHRITQNIVQLHGRHIAGTKSPYAMIEDPILQARSVCNLAAQIIKLSNPKNFLLSIGHQMHKITKKFAQKQRITLLIGCKRDYYDKYKKYLEIFLKQFNSSSISLDLDPINDKHFQSQNIMKYFPNYNQEIIFETFKVPYYNDVKQVPPTLVLASIINNNIQLYNPLGGCFLFKGALIAYLRGNRKKYVELEGYYKRLLPGDIDMAKRFIFQKFKRYTAADEFYTGIQAKNARLFKQAVAMVEGQHVEECLNAFLLKSIKEATSSMLSIGPHLNNYEPLIKKGWSIQRSVEDMSMKMEGQTDNTMQLQVSKYINIY